MNSFIDLERSLGGQPPGLGVLLSRIDVGRGREGLHLDQLPELLRSLAERTRVESIRASTALEGYEVDVERAAKLAQLTPARVRNRNEREFAGYRDAMDEIMRAGAPERLSIPFILHLHRVMFTPTDGGGGRLKRDDNVIAARDDEGRRIVIFEPPGHERVEWMLGELVARYNAACDEEAAHPLLLLGAFILDLLAIHPVADGNGRLARLITTHELLRLGYGVARYASVEQRIFETKNAYYAALRLSQANWHDATHTVWPWMEYLAGVIADAYDAFEHRLAAADSLEGLSKQEIVRRHIAQLPAGGRFRIRDLRATLPGISDQTFRLVLAELRQAGVLAGDGTGPQAGWTLIGPKPDR
jgi:Fic family protein